MLLACLLFAAGSPAAAPLYEDVTRAAGLEFVYRGGDDPALHLPSITGGGAALFDYDDDGDLDLYLVQAARLGPRGEPLPGEQGDRLLRNEGLAPGGTARVPRFVDVSAAVGLAPGGFGMGVASGDYDGDGWTDLLVTGYGALRLLRNARGQRFEDQTLSAGLKDDGWSVSASFFDYDRDGRLDLYVTRYVEYQPVRCVLPSTRPDYCGPKSFKAQRDRLFHNLGDGRFEDVSAALLGPHKVGAGLGVLAADLNDDGWLDLYVANDGSDNHLWLNQAGHGFRDEGLLAGVALSRGGMAQAGMGTDAGDADGDFDLDLFVANIAGETHAAYLNLGQGLFEERSVESGLAAATFAFTGFGTRFLDYDNDGRLDLVVVNGAVHLTETKASALDPLALGQAKLLFHNLGQARFADVSAAAGEAFARLDVSRGLAVGDVDDDGDPDLVVVNDMQPARLLLDRAGQHQPWLGLRLVTADGKRDALGAQAWLRRRGAPDLLRHVHTDGSYASASDPRLLFGLGAGRELVGLDVRWPDGRLERFPAPALGRYTTLRQGQGAP